MEKKLSTAWFWLAAIVALFIFLYLIKSILLPFVVGILVAYFLDPAADKLETWGASRTAATAIITISFFSVITTLLVVLVPLLFDQLSGLLADMPAYVAQFEVHYEPRLQEWMHVLGQGHVPSAEQVVNGLPAEIFAGAGSFAQKALQSGLALLNLGSLILITPVVAFYLLREWDVIVAKVNSLLPKQYAKTIREQVAEMDNAIAGFIRGQLNVCFIVGVFYALGLTIAGLKFGAIIGLLSGLLLIIPYVGAAVSTIIGVSVAFFQFGDVTPVLSVLAVYGTGQFLESYFLTPTLVGDKVGLHPLWIIFGMLAGAALFGFVGVFIAVPVTACIGVLIRFSVKQYLKSPYYKGA